MAPVELTKQPVLIQLSPANDGFTVSFSVAKGGSAVRISESDTMTPVVLALGAGETKSMTVAADEEKGKALYAAADKTAQLTVIAKEDK